MTIIQPAPSDRREILALFRDIRLSLALQGIRQWDRWYPNRWVIGRDLNCRNVHAIMDDGRIAGVVTLNTRQSSRYADIAWHGDSYACIHRLAVLPACQGRGIGGRLLKHAEDTARARGYASIRLDVCSANPGAANMYLRAGYTILGSIRYPFRPAPYLCCEKML
ncbi:GNAT family N-acetyltransferase [Cohnella sp. 56]|uniref:GNAT family N-acetyltransferase n=1 Tax=Cohnella sp. 56 TaxID=3113722 RepID=UPI0030E91952